MIVGGILVIGMLVGSVVANVVLVDLVHRRQARRLIEGNVPGLKPGDRVLTHFGFEATVVSVEGQLVDLRFGSGERERTIIAVRGSIVRKIDDGDPAGQVRSGREGNT